MKRYRVLSFDFDTRFHVVTGEIKDDWDEHVKTMHKKNQENVVLGLVREYGELAADDKRKNFIDLGPKPFSILAFHNRFMEQIRVAFVMEAYYPALTAASALGERILNYLILSLRDDFKSSPEYKRVYKKESFDNWDLAIDTLNAWKVLLPEVVSEYRVLREIRNNAIHFRPEVDLNDRALAIEAIKSLSKIIGSQFSAFGPQPWFITEVPGEVYIKKEYETQPFISKVYLANCKAVGPKHEIKIMPIQVNDEHDYEDREVSDNEFCEMRRFNNGG